MTRSNRARDYWTPLAALLGGIVVLGGACVGPLVFGPQVATAQSTTKAVPKAGTTSKTAAPKPGFGTTKPSTGLTRPGTGSTKSTTTTESKGDKVDPGPAAIPDKVYSTGYSGSYVELIDFINDQIRQGWKDNGVVPSAVADDGEWLRRVHLDIVGHIPDVETFEAFVADKDKAKRAKMIDKLLEDPGYVRSLTTSWTNLLIGRATPRNINRASLQKFLRESFGKNRAWNQIVSDLVAAEGNSEENGATNFLLSHLNEGAVPATAITARLFLGVQVQCTQCHNHPFNDWKQVAFWEFNSFFKQTGRRDHQKYNPQTGRNEFDYAELTRPNFEGPVYFERRNGLMEVAFPKYNGVLVSPEGDINRRQELAKIITTGEKTQVADAMVNRMWGHFFGYGFTKPVDDMGPHNAPSHPAILDRMGREFVKSGYDLKQLIRWICNTEAYSLTSRSHAKNAIDNPGAGESQLFSKMYIKSMSAEQLYDSLIIATNAHKSGRASWEQSERQRQQWMQQFVRTFGTDENDEATSFDGTIPQALMMMNGPLTRDALSGGKGSHLGNLLADTKMPVDNKIKMLYIATLTRIPTANEIAVVKKTLGAAKDSTEAFQDLYWALLNANEFIFVH